MNGTDEENALARAIGVGTSPVATPEMLTRGLMWLLLKARQDLEDRTNRSGQEYVRASELANIFGVTRDAANKWLDRLRAAGRVRVYCPPAEAGAGTRFYSIAEIKEAFLELATEGGKA